jgi:hypothetical protein
VRRTLSVLVAVLGAAILLSACGGGVGPNAATVGSTDINRKDFEDELKTISENKAFVKSLDAQNAAAAQQSGVTPEKVNVTDGGVSVPALATPWLNTLVNQAIIDQTFKARGLKVSASDRATATSAVKQRYGAKIYSRFPKSFQDDLIDRAARLAAVEGSLPKAAAPTDAELEAILQQTKAQYCPGDKLIGVIAVPTQAAADAIAAQLAQGGDFSTIAKTQSTDTTSAEVGGLKACADTQGYQQLEAPVRAAAEATPSGSVSPPVAVTGGFVIVKVSPWDLANARPVAESLFAQNQESPVAAFVNARLLKSKIWIDPRYGRVKRAGRTVTLLPPTPPNPRSSPTTTASTTPTGAQVP